MAQMQPLLVASKNKLVFFHYLMTNSHQRLDRITQTARELSEATGQTCIAAQADVRQPKQVQDAVAKTIAKFGRLDFVICGKFMLIIVLAY